jgi:pyruvate dehydrogenase complex dehydrogenase (E1) component
MPTAEELLVAMRRKPWPLLETAMEAVLTDVRGVLEEAEHQRTQVLAEVAQERANGLADVAKELAQDNAEVEARWAELHREVAAMHTHTEKQDRRVDFNIGGHRFETSVQTLRRLPHIFFDAYFSGRYAQDVCKDGSTFVDLSGEYCGGAWRASESVYAPSSEA